jgi:hypothetical protein
MYIRFMNSDCLLHVGCQHIWRGAHHVYVHMLLGLWRASYDRGRDHGKHICLWLNGVLPTYVGDGDISDFVLVVYMNTKHGKTPWTA